MNSEEIKKVLRSGDTLESAFYIHEQLHQGSPLHRGLVNNPEDNIGIIISRNGIKRFYRLSEYLKNEVYEEEK